MPTIEIKYEPYNELRFSRPWAARVSLHAGRTRLRFEFIKHACLPDGRTLLLDGIEAGAYFAHGIKDRRRGNRTEVNICRCTAPGQWECLSQTDAIRALREARAAECEAAS